MINRAYPAHPLILLGVGDVLSLAKEPKRFPKSERTTAISGTTTQNAPAAKVVDYPGITADGRRI